MLQLTPHMKIMVAISHVDFRCGIDGLAALCRKIFDEDSKSGVVFVFRNRKTTAVKILLYDSTGFWLCQKRLSRGCFAWPKRHADAQNMQMDARDLLVLLWDGNPAGVFKSQWQRIDDQKEEQQGYSHSVAHVGGGRGR